MPNNTTQFSNFELKKKSISGQVFFVSTATTLWFLKSRQRLLKLHLNGIKKKL